MAVPPAPDGDAVGDPSDSDQTTSTAPDHEPDAGTRLPVWVLAGAFAVVLGCLVASLVAFGRAGWSVDGLVDEPVDRQADRERVMAVAQEFVTRFSTYGPDDLDEQGRMPGYVERVGEYLTPKYSVTFEQQVVVLEQIVEQQQSSGSAEVYGTGVASLDDDKARVLVAGVATTSVPDPKRPQRLVPVGEEPFRFEVALVRTGGEWLVDEHGPVGTLDQPEPELPTEAPTGSPDASPTAPDQGSSPSGRSGDETDGGAGE